MPFVAYFSPQQSIDAADVLLAQPSLLWFAKLMHLILFSEEVNS